MYDKFHDGDGPVGRYIRNKFFPDYSYKGIVLDVGGGPAVEHSFSRHFFMNGWRTIIVEPNDKHVEEHKQCGHEVYQYAISNYEKQNVEITFYGGGNEMGSPVLGDKAGLNNNLSQRKIICDVITLNKLLSDLKVKDVDIMSLDVEGWELEAMNGLDTSLFNIQFIVVENFFNNEEYPKFMKQKGYDLIHKISFNEIYQKIT